METQTSINKKLETYLLYKPHATGGSKAKWFDEALGFNHSNVNKLSKQILFDSKMATQTAITEYGTKFNQIISITGANGKVIDVTFAWIKKSRWHSTFSNCYIKKIRLGVYKLWMNLMW